VARRAEAAGLTRERQQVFRPAVRTPDPDKPRSRIAAVKVALDHLFDDRPKIPVLPLEASLVFGQEPLKMIENHPVEHRALRMARTIDSRHIGNADIKNMPEAVRGRSGGRENEPSTDGYTNVKRR
jgi:hypothetical protein